MFRLSSRDRNPFLDTTFPGLPASRSAPQSPSMSSKTAFHNSNSQNLESLTFFTSRPPGRCSSEALLKRSALPRPNQRDFTSDYKGTGVQQTQRSSIFSPPSHFSTSIFYPPSFFLLSPLSFPLHPYNLKRPNPDPPKTENKPYRENSLL